MDSTAPTGRVARTASEPCRLAYFVSRFPTTTETFVVRELNAVAAQPGIEADLYALFPTPPGVVQESARRWIDKVHRARPLRCLEHIARWMARRPLRLTSTAMLVVKDHFRNPRVLVRALTTFGVAAVHAGTLEASKTKHVHAHFGTSAVYWRRRAVALVALAVAVLLAVRVATALFAGIEAGGPGTPAPAVSVRPAAASAPVHVVHCGIDTDFYRPAPHAPPRSGAVHALCVASLREKKGHRVLLEALAQEAAELGRIELDLVGDGPLRAELEQLAARLGLASRVRFHGDLTEHVVAEMLQAADIFVLSSVIERNGDTEGIPVALMEAMAAGLPVVASHLSGVPELVRDGETGLLAEPGDVSGLADRLVELLAGPDLARARATSARGLVEREFSLGSSAERLATLFTENPVAAAAASEPRSGVLAHA